MLDFFLIVNSLIILPMFIYGCGVGFINKKIMKNLQNNSKYWVDTIIAFVGTPIHELSHLIMAIIFRYKIKKVALYRPFKRNKDGVLGYVNYTYNSNSLYQNIGTFFVGIAPLIGGSIVLFILMKFLLPEIYETLNLVNIDNLNIFEILKSLSTSTIQNINNLFTNYNKKENLIIFLILAYSITTHMSLSDEDLKGIILGFISFEIIIFLISLFLSFYSLAFINPYILAVSSYLISILILGFVFCIISYLISIIISILPV